MWSSIPTYLKLFHILLLSARVKGFRVVIEPDVDVLWNSLGLSMIECMVAIGTLVSSALSKSRFIIWKSLVHVLLKRSLENFEHYFVSM